MINETVISYQYCDEGPDLSSAPVTPLAFDKTRPQVRTWISAAFRSCKTRLDLEAEPDGVLLLVEVLYRLVFHQIDDWSINNASHAHLPGIRLELEGPSLLQRHTECRTSCHCRPSVNVDRGIWSSALRAWDNRRSVFNSAFPFGEFSRAFIYNKQVSRGGGAGTPSSVLPSSHLTLTPLKQEEEVKSSPASR